MRSSLPAPYRPFVPLLAEEGVADVVKADWAVRVYLLGEIEHVLGLFVLVHLGVCDDAVAVARLECGFDLLYVLEGGYGEVVLSDAGVIDGETVENFGVVAFQVQGLFVSIYGLFEPLSGVECQSCVEMPGAVGWIHFDGLADLIKCGAHLAVFVHFECHERFFFRFIPEFEVARIKSIKHGRFPLLVVVLPVRFGSQCEVRAVGGWARTALGCSIGVRKSVLRLFSGSRGVFMAAKILLVMAGVTLYNLKG